MAILQEWKRVYCIGKWENSNKKYRSSCESTRLAQCEGQDVWRRLLGCPVTRHGILLCLMKTKWCTEIGLANGLDASHVNRPTYAPRVIYLYMNPMQNAQYEWGSVLTSPLLCHSLNIYISEEHRCTHIIGDPGRPFHPPDWSPWSPCGLALSSSSSSSS